MTLFQLLMLGASAFFAFKIYEHIQTLKDPEDETHDNGGVDIAALIDEGDKAVADGDLQKALAIYSEANFKDANNEEALFKMGYTLTAQERYDEALETYYDLLELDPQEAAVHQAIASVYRKKGDYESAQSRLETSIELESTNPITYYNYGNLLVDMNESDKAKEMYEKALELDPEFSEAQNELEKLS